MRNKPIVQHGPVHTEYRVSEGEAFVRLVFTGPLGDTATVEWPAEQFPDMVEALQLFIDTAIDNAKRL